MILEKAELSSLSGVISPSEWTFIIAAAGKGTRLGYHLPKVLFPVAGTPILGHLIEKCRGLVSHLLVIVSSEGAVPIGAYLDTLYDIRWNLVLQEKAIGMGDAVLRGLKACQTTFALCVWGDQITMSRTTAETIMKAGCSFPDMDLFFPTVWKTNPYIHFERGAKGEIINVLQKREGDVLPSTGESDCGIFAIRVSPLIKAFANAQGNELLGFNTHEVNFLPIFKKIKTLSLRIASEFETKGINTLQDASEISNELSNSF